MADWPGALAAGWLVLVPNTSLRAFALDDGSDCAAAGAPPKSIPSNGSEEGWAGGPPLRS